MRVAYRHEGKCPQGYKVHLVTDKDVEEYDASVATFGRQNRGDFYADRQLWVRVLKSLAHHRGTSKRTVICLHGAFVNNTMYNKNMLRLILQHLGVECYATQCMKSVIVYTENVMPQPWIQECIRETLFVIEAQLLAMLPANVATPKRLQQLFCKLFKSVPNIKLRVYNLKDLQRMGFGLITAVGKSATSPPCMVVAERKGVGKKIALVGKGVTFDSGGLALKPKKELMKMKYDKIGAVYAAYTAYQLMQDPTLKEHNIIGVFPLAENALSDNAIHPGDVVKSFLGKTVEITDPDAEGRLLLADAFGYLHNYKPDVVLDVATLTGHAESIHCDHSGYFFASSESWKHAIEKSSFALGERMIAMPSWTSGYEDMLKSPVADLVNSPPNASCSSSSFIATLFLKEFIPEQCDWLHIDLAHETDGAIPVGHGIRTMIHAVHSWLRKK